MTVLLAELPPELWNRVSETGITVLFLVAAIRWLIAQSEKQHASNQGVIKELITELNKERSERIDVLETHVEACDTDRRELRDMLLNHLSRQATAPTIAIAQAPGPHTTHPSALHS